VAGPTLLHLDIHKRNIFVSEDDPSSVTAVIDWQSTSPEPAFVYATEKPDFVKDPDVKVPIFEKLMSMGSDTEITEMSKGILVKNTEKEGARRRHENDVLTCRKTFEVVLQGDIEKSSRC
jgi:hypothetical protein